VGGLALLLGLAMIELHDQKFTGTLASADSGSAPDPPER
jgi:hypothetical protein